MWNLAYDEVLRTPRASGVTVVGYADDTLVLGTGRTRLEAKRCAELGAAQATMVFRKLGLRTNDEKTEAM